MNEGMRLNKFLAEGEHTAARRDLTRDKNKFMLLPRYLNMNSMAWGA